MARLQFVGSIPTKSDTWLWSRDNNHDAGQRHGPDGAVLEFGREHDVARLTTPRWEADGVDSWAMTVIAARILKASDAYRSGKEDGRTFMVLTDTRWADESDGKPSFPADANGEELRRRLAVGDLLSSSSIRETTEHRRTVLSLSVLTASMRNGAVDAVSLRPSSRAEC